MKISDFRKNNYDYSSQKASEVTRQLAFAGIALVWIFKLGGENPKIPGELIAPTFCFALTLAFDLLHYVIATILWVDSVDNTKKWEKYRAKSTQMLLHQLG